MLIAHTFRAPIRQQPVYVVSCLKRGGDQMALGEVAPITWNGSH